MLEIRGLHSGYGKIEALHGIDLDVPEGEIVSLIGANGAGKTTLLMTICGRPAATRGSIRFNGRDITRLRTHEIAALGIAHAPEGRRIFPRMSVLENLQMGAILCDPSHFAEDLDDVLTLFPRLRERISQRGGTLSGGEQQMLAIARALMSRPRLLLLDEPSLGLAPLVTKQLFGNILRINRERKMTILLVEQNAFQALRLADHAHIIVNGRIEISGPGAALLNDPAVRAAYLEGIRPQAEVMP
ncbi:MAG: ABC transporter ATP-binding protein [Parvibaculum sp.]|uniref:ABC transporter ATP-binding protein n=1 Tax=Parvibaculum sp. TaxID=2024848 RepID=UPI003C73FD11